VHAVLCLEVSESIITLHLYSGGFYAGLITVQQICHGHLVAVPLTPAHIHTHEHGGPVVRLSTAGAGIYSEDRTEIVTLLAEHILQFQSLHGLFRL